MYDIVNVIYGIPYTEKIAVALALNTGQEWTDPANVVYDPLKEYGFEFLYTGADDFTPGYLGIEFEAIPSWEMVPNKIYEPTLEMRAAVLAHIAVCPPWLQEVMPAPEVCFVWSTS